MEVMSNQKQIKTMNGNNQSHDSEQNEQEEKRTIVVDEDELVKALWEN